MKQKGIFPLVWKRIIGAPVNSIKMSLKPTEKNDFPPKY